MQREIDAARVDAHSRGARSFVLLWVGGPVPSGAWSVGAPPRSDPATALCLRSGTGRAPRVSNRLGGHGVEFRDFFQQRTTVPTVFGFIPAASIYFDDPDGHLLELLAPIAVAPRPDLTAVSWAEWTRATAGATFTK